MADHIHPVTIQPGCLYIAATPIGNLGDVSSRTLSVLQQVDVVLCEDTRTTGRLLASLDVHPKRLMSLHEHNEQARVPQVLRLLRDGAAACLVSDAGTPLISDPGYRVVRAARLAGLPVIPLPGPSAVIAALSVSGLPTDRFCFAGFVPKKAGARTRLWTEIHDRGVTTVVYVPARSLIKILNEIKQIYDPEICVVREATKLHEEYLFGTVSKVLEQLEGRQAIKGEITLVIGAGKLQNKVKNGDV